MFSSRKFSKNILQFFSFVVFIFLLSFSSQVRSGGRYIFGYVTKPFFYFGKNFFADNNIDEIKKENKNLQDELIKKTIDYSELKILKQENEVLRKELNYVKKNNLSYKVSDILAVTSVPELNIMILNKGSDDNIVPGMGVISENGIFVGKIFKVDKYTSELMLVNNDNISISARILNKKETLGIVSGKNNLTIKMNFIPLDDSLSLGEIVVTSGREKYIPAGLIIGKLTSINHNDNDFFQNATIESSVNISTLKHVVILTIKQ